MADGIVLKWKRLSAGSYVAVVGAGERDRYRIEHVVVEAADAGGYGRTDHWEITYPGEVRADGAAETLGVAKRLCDAHASADRSAWSVFAAG